MNVNISLAKAQRRQEWIFGMPSMAVSDNFAIFASLRELFFLDGR
jgi:hypothetical protein